ANDGVRAPGAHNPPLRCNRPRGRAGRPALRPRSFAMRIAIFGAGAIGGYMGAKLASVGVDVTLIARGPHLAAMQANGLKLIEGEGPEATETVVHPNLVSDTRDHGPHEHLCVDATDY